MRIVVVEDEPKAGLALQDGVQAEGYDVQLARTGKDGFFLAGSQPFDLIILDVRLNNSGRDVLRARLPTFAFHAPQFPVSRISICGIVVITAAFIRYPISGLAAAAAVFAPPFFIVIVAAPHYGRFAGNPFVKAFVPGVTAAGRWELLWGPIIVARRGPIDVPTVPIALAVFAAPLKLRRSRKRYRLYLPGCWNVFEGRTTETKNHVEARKV